MRIRTFRQELHQIPEVGLEVEATCRYIKEALKDLPCELESPIQHSVVAYYDNHKQDTIAFRCDMDALEVLEQNDVPYKSKHEGRMHACGHDGHMAIMLEFAHVIKNIYQTFPYNVLLIFQPGEETPGGAKPILDTGLFEKYHVKYVFGYHLWPYMPKGSISTKPNEFMAKVAEITIKVNGVSAHAAKYQDGCDALYAASDLLMRLYQMEQNEIDPSVHRLLRFGKMEAGSVRNVIANCATMEGSIRSFDDQVFEFMLKRVYEISKEIEQLHQVKVEIQLSNGYPALINDEKLVQQIMKQSERHIHILEKPEMISEDFAFYLQKARGVFFYLGTGTNIALHSDNFDFDEELLYTAVAMNIDLCKMEF